MERKAYLKIENYKELHNFLVSIIFKIEDDVSKYLKNKGLQDLLIKKNVVLANNQPVFLYSLSYEFFEEEKESGYNETQVIFVVVLTFDSENFTFNVLAGVNSMYDKTSSGWYKKLKTLPDSAKTYFDNVPNTFMKILDNFFINEFKYRNEEGNVNSQ
jgi:hypothetical protein